MENMKKNTISFFELRKLARSGLHAAWTGPSPKRSEINGFIQAYVSKITGTLPKLVERIGFDLRNHHLRRTLELLGDDNTVPFITRYNSIIVSMDDPNHQFGFYNR